MQGKTKIQGYDFQVNGTELVIKENDSVLNIISNIFPSEDELESREIDNMTSFFKTVIIPSVEEELNLSDISLVVLTNFLIAVKNGDLN